jgi:predicted RNase H-like HicB family nuclease
MVTKFTLEYWQDEGWFVGRLKEVPDVFSQGETLKELESNILDAYRMMHRDENRLKISANKKSKKIAVTV